MKVLMLSTDVRIFEEGSEVRHRMQKYGELFEELHIIVLTGRKFEIRNSKFEIAKNVLVYPTNSRNKIFSLWDGYRLATQIITNYQPVRTEIHPGGLPITNFIITSQDPFETGLVALRLARRFSLPLQIQAHTDFLSPWFARESFKNRIRVWVAKRVIPHADRVRVVSKRIAESISHAFPDYPKEKIEILPIIVPFSAQGDERVIRDRYAAYDTIILMASRLTREKDISMALRAFKKIVAAHPKTLFLIVGEGSEKKHLQLLITNYQLQNNVIFEPWTNDLAPYFAAADIYALSSRYEGYGRTIIQAMHAGVPIIMTDVGVAGELVQNGKEGVVVSVGDEATFSTGLARLVSDASLRKKMGEAAKIKTDAMIEEKEWFARFRESFICKPKLIYAVPRMENGDATHFAYLPRFAEELAKEYDLAVFSESKIKTKNIFSRIRETTRVMRVWRKRGHRIAYVHYSFLTAWCAKHAGLTVFYWNCGEPWNYTRSWWREWFERHVYKKIDFLVTGTEGLANKYAEVYGIPRERVKVMGNWIDVDTQEVRSKKYEIKEDIRKQLQIPVGAKVILFVHRLSKRKGAQYLPEIMDKLRDQNVVLLIAGEGSEQEGIEVRSRKYEVWDKIRFLGSVSHDPTPTLPGVPGMSEPRPLEGVGVTNYYAIADLFLMPSDEEGFPHVLLEAMAAGVPYVGTKVGGVEEITPPGLKPYLSEKGDIEGISQAVRRILALSPSEKEALQEEIVRWVKRYDLSRAIENFEAIIRV